MLRLIENYHLFLSRPSEPHAGCLDWNRRLTLQPLPSYNVFRNTHVGRRITPRTIQPRLRGAPLHAKLSFLIYLAPTDEDYSIG